LALTASQIARSRCHMRSQNPVEPPPRLNLN